MYKSSILHFLMKMNEYKTQIKEKSSCTEAIASYYLDFTTH